MKVEYGIILLALVVLASGCTQSPESTESENGDQPDTSQPSTSSPTDEEPELTRIVLTDSGFEPADITVQVGETVKWVDQSGSGMWVASNEHPSHTNYAGTSLREHCQNGDQTSSAFDQCSTGDQFSFTFEKAGEWSYHNHVNSAQGGTVTVQN